MFIKKKEVKNIINPILKESADIKYPKDAYMRGYYRCAQKINFEIDNLEEYGKDATRRTDKNNT